MRFSPSLGAACLLLIFLAFHLPYLPVSLEDLDSTNFALGVRHFDVAHHQPHPPGYPLFVALGRLAMRVSPGEPQALALVSVVAGALGILAMLAFFTNMRRQASDGSDVSRPILAALVATVCPLYWFTAARPLSDMVGLAAAVAVQAMTTGAAGTGQLAGAAFCAGLGGGIRTQVIWLTAPLLLFAVVKRGWSRATLRGALLCGSAFAAGVLVWLVPLVAVSGGALAYGRALFGQGAEDFQGVEMLWTQPSLRVLISALYHALVAPWARADLAGVSLALALVGLVVALRRRRPALVVLAVAFGPYLVLDLLFQETFTTRYALPLVVPVAFLVAEGIAVCGRRAAPVLALLLAMAAAHVAGASVAAYAREPAPAFRMLAEMRRGEGDVHPVLAADRRQSLDLRRAFTWAGDAGPAVVARLSAPPKHEWLEAVRYWTGGGHAPLWFVVDPKRAQMELVDHGEPRRYRWRVPYPVLLGGVRPSDIDWFVVTRPDWFVGQGWALTPESAGTAREDGTGPSRGGIAGWVRRQAEPVTVLIGGRNIGDRAVHVDVSVDGRRAEAWDLAPGSFLRTFQIPPTAGAGYVELRVVSGQPGVQVEQFGAAAPTRALLGFGAGWHEQEYNPATGTRWRWMPERAILRIIGDGSMVVRLDWDAPRTQFDRPSRLVVKVRDIVLYDGELWDPVTLDLPLTMATGPGAERLLTLETSQTFTPAERSSRSHDRRRLGLRLLSARVIPAS